MIYCTGDIHGDVRNTNDWHKCCIHSSQKTGDNCFVGDGGRNFFRQLHETKQMLPFCEDSNRTYFSALHGVIMSVKTASIATYTF